MADTDFLENYGLYRRYELRAINAARSLDIAINMPCSTCRSNQTFQPDRFDSATQRLVRGQGGSIKDGQLVTARYCCAACGLERAFLIGIEREFKWICKMGQYPAFEIAIEPALATELGEYADYLRKGSVCEVQGYGVAAFAYYRRIVEGIIEQLLGKIEGLLDGEARDKYADALAKTRASIVAEEKIKLVKDLLPATLRPGGVNSLGVLYDALSEGLHAKSDEDCLAYAEVVRSSLLFLVKQVLVTIDEAKEFSASMKLLLDKKAKVQAEKKPPTK